MFRVESLFLGKRLISRVFSHSGYYPASLEEKDVPTPAPGLGQKSDEGRHGFHPIRTSFLYLFAICFSLVTACVHGDEDGQIDFILTDPNGEDFPKSDKGTREDSINLNITALFKKTPSETGDTIRSLGLLDNDEKPRDPDGYKCSVERFEATAKYDESICFDPASSTFWLGSIIDGSSFMTGEYIPLTLPRGPLTFSISQGNSTKGTGVVEAASLSGLREEVSKILEQNAMDPTSAQVSFEINEIYSKQHLAMKLGAHFDGLGNKFDLDYDFDDTDIQSRILVKLTQVYYTLDMDLPDHPSDFFAPSVVWDDIYKELRDNTSPVYISSMKIGKMAFFSIESKETVEKVRESLDYSLNTDDFAGDAEAVDKYRNVLNQSTIRAQIFGGNGQTEVRAIDGFDQFREWVTGGGSLSEASPRAPLSFQLRFLKDNSVASVGFTSRYETRTCTKIATDFRVSMEYIRAIKQNDGGDSNNPNEFYGSLESEAGYYNVLGWKYKSGPTLTNEVLWNWSRDDKREVDVGNGRVSVYDGPENPIYKVYSFDWKNLNDACIVFTGELNDWDGFLDSDDSFGSKSRRICVKNLSSKADTGDGFYEMTLSYRDDVARIGFKIQPIDW